MDQKTRHLVAFSALSAWATLMLVKQAGVKMSQKLPSTPALVMAAVVPFVLLGVLFQPLLSKAAEAPTINTMTTPGATTLINVPAPTVFNIAPEPKPEPKKEVVVPTAPPSFEATQTFKAVITQYSRADSCHNKRNGECIMASGKGVYVGAVACPKFLKLGTRIVLSGKVYTCEDRYAQRLDGLRGLPTIDVFVEANARGKSTEEISVLK